MCESKCYNGMHPDAAKSILPDDPDLTNKMVSTRTGYKLFMRTMRSVWRFCERREGCSDHMDIYVKMCTLPGWRLFIGLRQVCNSYRWLDWKREIDFALKTRMAWCHDNMSPCFVKPECSNCQYLDRKKEVL